MPEIIAGADGPEHSRRAFGWALREAVLRGTPLTAVSVRPVVVMPPG